MKKIMALLLALTFLFALVACSASTENNSTDSDDSAGKAASSTAAGSSKEVLPLEVKEFGYSMSDEYLFYAICIHNPNANYLIELPTFRITAKDADGKVVGTEDQTLSMVYPGQDFYYGSQGFSCTSAPETVDVEILPAEEYNITEVSFAEQPEYKPLTVVNPSLNHDEFSTNVLGEIKNDNDYSIDNAIVTVVFRDNEGNVVGGELTFVDRISAGGTAAFEINCYGGFETDNYEVYANLW